MTIDINGVDAALIAACCINDDEFGWFIEGEIK